ncbi:MAG TPA: PQQ-binding-like beta-propeller repeat protein [archaeon]|nr:PQQ-binding-like beta-propeller repeat protein [archaeon]
MFPKRSGSFQTSFLAFLFTIFALSWSVAVTQAAVKTENPGYSNLPLSADILEISGITRGVCSVLGGDNRALALELAGSGAFLVDFRDPGGQVIEAAQKLADEKGLYGRSIIAEKGSIKQLPYADNMVDLILSVCLTDSRLAELSLPEILRVLRPGGKAVIGRLKKVAGGEGILSAARLQDWLKSAGEAGYTCDEDDSGLRAVVTKPPMKGTDNWSHWEHGPDNNPVSTDTAIKAPYMTHFLGLPYYIAMPAITTVAEGRVFTAMGHIAHHEREEPWLNTLVAWNGYNGTELWKRKLPDGYLVHRSAFVATGSTYYMINPEGNGCLMLDPATGVEKDRVRIPELEGEWKWMALSDGVLFALAGKEKDPPQTTIVRSPAQAWSWEDLSTGYYEKRIPWGFGTVILAYDLDRKKVLWTHTEEAPVDSRGIVIGDGKVFFYGPDSHIGCLDAKTGKLLWANNNPEVRELIEEPGQGLISTPGFRTTCLCLYTPKALFYEAQTRMNIVAVSNRDGSLLWHRKKTSNNPNMLYADGNLVVGIGPQGNTQIIDPLTGATLEDLGFKKRSCVRLTAVWDSFFCRGWPEGLTRYDRLAKKVLFNGAVRPACNDGVIPANGLLYLGPWLCDCNLSLMGRLALCSAGAFKFEYKATEADRLELGVKDLTRVAAFDISDRDWPAYRGNNARSSSSRAEVPGQVEKIWEYEPGSPVKSSAPTSAGGLVFLGGDDCKVRAVDAATGVLKWSFLTGGPVIQPPTIWQGRAYVGSGDGYVYALEAATGKMLWRFRAAPVERKIMVYGSLCSTWPVNSGVLVQDGVAYAAAGIVDYDGTYVYALDAVTGKIKWQNNTSGHLDQSLRKGVSAQGVLTIANGRLWMPGGNVVSPASYDLATGKYLGPLAGDGSPKANRGEEIAILNDRYVLLGGKLRFSASENVVNPEYFTAFDLRAVNVDGKGKNVCRGKITPAWDGNRFLVVNGRFETPVCYSIGKVEKYLVEGNPDNQKTWPERDWTAARPEDPRLKGSDAVSLAVAQNAALIVYESPVVRDRNSRWTLYSLNPDNGSLVWEQRLPSPALPGSLLVGREGRVIVVLENGNVACFATKGAS